MRAELVGDADVDRAVAAFAALCPVAARHGVRLCIEASLPADRIAAIAARVGSEAFGCYFDLANPIAHKGLDPEAEIRALGGLIAAVHVKDTRVTTGDCRPGTGRVDFVECARALAEIGFDGWLTLETPPAPPPLVSRDLSFTRSVFAGLDAPLRWPRLGAFPTEFGAGEVGRLVDEFDRFGLESTQLMGPLLDECLGDAARAEAVRASSWRRRASPCRRSVGTAIWSRPTRRCGAPTSSTFAAASRSLRHSAPTWSRPRPGR